MTAQMTVPTVNSSRRAYRRLRETTPSAAPKRKISAETSFITFKSPARNTAAPMALSKTGNASSIFSFRFDTRYCVYPYMENSSRITRMIFRTMFTLLVNQWYVAPMSIALM